jgi:predicted DNA-binding transcriptional regulator AlpA
MDTKHRLEPAASAAGSTQPRRPTTALPESLADVALIDGPTAAAAASISVSQWYDLVRNGAAPQPAFRAPRCTRWRLADVRLWLVQWAERESGSEAADTVIDQARRASSAAAAKRKAARDRGD